MTDTARTKTMNLPVEFRLFETDYVGVDGTVTLWIGEARLCNRPLAHVFGYDGATTRVDAIRLLQIKIRERCEAAS